MKKVSLILLLVIFASVALMAATPLKLIRVTFINKSAHTVYLKLEGQTQDQFYYLTIPKGDRIEDAAEDLKQFAEVTVERGKALVCVVGENMAGAKGTASRVFKAVAEAGVNIRMISQGARELNISLLIDDDDIPIVLENSLKDVPLLGIIN